MTRDARDAWIEQARSTLNEFRKWHDADGKCDCPPCGLARSLVAYTPGAGPGEVSWLDQMHRFLTSVPLVRGRACDHTRVPASTHIALRYGCGCEVIIKSDDDAAGRKGGADRV